MLKPILYKRTSTGATQVWQVEIEGSKYRTISGQLSGKKTTSAYTQAKPKNVGRANETSAEWQARMEVDAMYTKKLAQGGYHTECEDVDNAKFFKPMLAKKYEDYPITNFKSVFSQPKLDGCLQGSSKIITDQGTKTIREIVDQKLSCKVLSYNEETKQEEFRQVVGWFNNGLAHYTDWYYVKLSKSHILKCTGNHKLFTPEGWKEVRSLNPKKDTVLANRGSDRLFSLMVGTLLGDACVALERRYEGSKSYRITFRHVNKKLLDFKIKTLGLNGKRSISTSGYGSKIYVFTSEALTSTKFPIKDLFAIDPNKKGSSKYFTYKFMYKHVSLEALSLWIADDGSLAFNNGNNKTPRLFLHTQGFSEKQVEIFVQFFTKRFKCTPNINLDKKVKDGSGLFLTFTTKDTLYLLNLLRDYHCEGVEYKYYFETKDYITGVQNEYAWSKPSICKSRYGTYQVKYDLEVEGNHNYFANKILVHNCRAICNKDGLWSRQGKPFASTPHIIRALIPFFKANPNGILDGELYADKFSDNFGEIVSLVRKKDPTAHELAESSCYIAYHVYDYPSVKGDFYDRYKQLMADLPDHPHLKWVETTGCNSQDTLDRKYGEYLEQGYEGQIIRIGGIPYEQKRSKSLLKRKEFQDAEFEILDIVEGEGNRSGMAGKVWYKWKGTDKFSSGLRGSHEWCKQLLKDKSKYTKGTGTVRFQGYNPEDGKPRFPVTVALFTGKRDI